jgi:predicted RNase H-like nuclease
VAEIWQHEDIITKAENCDDIFDALIAAVLGLLTQRPFNNGALPVKLYGDRDAGAILLPVCAEFDDMHLAPKPIRTKRV